MKWPIVQLRARRRAQDVARATSRRKYILDRHFRPGPAAVALARLFYERRSDVCIDPLETEFRAQDDGIFVRAWISVPDTYIPDDLLVSVRETSSLLAPLSPEAREVFYLSTAYGLTTADIASWKQMRVGKVRKILLRVIACLDVEPLDQQERAGETRIM